LAGNAQGIKIVARISFLSKVKREKGERRNSNPRDGEAMPGAK